MAPRTPTKAPAERGPSLADRRIVVKAGTNGLTGRGPGLDHAMMASLVAQIVAVRRLGAQVLLVTSGAIAAGREALGEPQLTKGVALAQMLAAVGQSRLMHAYQELFSRDDVVVAQTLLTRRDVDDRIGYLNLRNTLEGLIDAGVVPIVNENDVVDTAEIGQERFGDNDTLSALVANLVDADLLVLLTDTGGRYTAAPARDPRATLRPLVERGRGRVVRVAGGPPGHHVGGHGQSLLPVGSPGHRHGRPAGDRRSRAGHGRRRARVDQPDRRSEGRP